MFSTLQYERLPNTAHEAEAVRQALPSAKLFLRENATEGAVTGVHRPLVLHVATHGFFLGVTKDPARWNALLRSGLLFAGVNQGRSGTGEDGVLTALEMSTMDLTGTELVVLSACDTGLGDIRAGDGVYGLRRALLLAGAASQVISLWQVQDDATKDLMHDFYSGMLANLPRGEALRTAQLKLAHGAGERTYPFFWAAFELSGERGVLDFGRALSEAGVSRR